MLRRLVTVYYFLLASVFSVALAVYWLALFFLGHGSGYGREFRLGIIGFDFEILWPFTVIMAPAAFFCLCYGLKRVSKDGMRFANWKGLSALSIFLAIQAPLALAPLLLFGVPYSSAKHVDWKKEVARVAESVKAAPKEVARQTAEKPTPPSDETLNYPTLPLQPFDPYNWTIRDLGNNEVPMSQFKGKVVFLNFWATWCGYCILEFPNIQNLYDAMKDNPGIAFILLSPEEPDVVQKWCAGQQYTLPFYTIDRNALPKAFEPSGFPTTFILAPDGTITFRHSGFVAWDGENTKRFLQNFSELVN